MNAQSKPPISFTSVALRPRHDGWTADKQIAFIEALAETGIVEEACRRVGMSDTSAYTLRRRPLAAPFREAWDAAVDYSAHLLEQASFSRSLNGVARPIFYKGEQVGEWRHFDERLTMFLLRTRRRARFGRWVELMPPPGENGEPDPAVELDGGLDKIEWQPDHDTDPDQDNDQSDPDSRAR